MRSKPRRLFSFIGAVLACSCSSSGGGRSQPIKDSGTSSHDVGASSDGGAKNSLSGTESQVFSLSFTSVVILFEQQEVSVKYAAASSDPAILIVNTAGIARVAGTTIDLTELESGLPRGVLQNVNSNGDGVTDQLVISSGTVVFDQAPQASSTLSGQFTATVMDGHTISGDFSATVLP